MGISGISILENESPIIGFYSAGKYLIGVLYESEDAFAIYTLPDLDSIGRIGRFGNGPGEWKSALYAEHFIYSDNRITGLLTRFFNACLMHSFIPSNFMESVIVPLVKDKRGNISDSSNYRPLAITSVASKIFELLLLNRYASQLTSSDNQLSFKSKHSTELCTFALKHV